MIKFWKPMAKNSNKDKMVRIAIVNEELCKPDKCAAECKRYCPVNRIGKKCIEIPKKAVVDETLCIGCGQCEKKCPFNAISIVNLPTDLESECSHRYGKNGFRLHRLPIPRPGKVLGLVGSNGIGKSTALKILSGKLKPNLGILDKDITWEKILQTYRGSELHGYFSKLAQGKIVTSNKIQYIDKIPKLLEKKFNMKNLTVGLVLEKYNARNMKDYYSNVFELNTIMDRELQKLSGGELQRFSLAVACMQKADIYIFDEPTSFLDVRQRLTAAKEIRRLAEEDEKYVLVVEHDLAILDLLSDYGCVLYGKSGAYGVISTPFSIKMAINIFLDGFIPTENMRFREMALKFNAHPVDEFAAIVKKNFQYSNCVKTYKSPEGQALFQLQISAGTYSSSEIIVLLGENGMGKTTMVGLLAGLIPGDNDANTLALGMEISVKPQRIIPQFRGTVQDLLAKKLKGKQHDPEFQNTVIKPLHIEYLLESEIQSLSGGELQRIALIICLGKEADVYLIDEPAAFLDVDQRIAVGKILKNFAQTKNKTLFVVEHDLLLVTYIADRIVVFSGTPGKSAIATAAMDSKDGMNTFLRHLDITFRQDPTNHRPRVNKPGSAKDKEQKSKSTYFF